MKNKIILSTLLSLLSAGFVLAKPDGKERPTPPTPAEMLEMFDTDDSGALELDEMEAAREKRKEMRDEKKEKMSEKRKERQGRDSSEQAVMVIERFDEDGDGNLNVEEVQVFLETMKEKRSKGPKGGSQKQN